MKIIFLDLDGVLNVIPDRNKGEHGYDKWGPIYHDHLVENLGTLIEETTADIVISSSHRSNGLKHFQDMWRDRVYPGHVIGTTPYLPLCRGYEIEAYLDTHKTCDEYVILDDDDDMLESQMSNFVMTSNNPNHPDCIDVGYGLTKICTKQAIEILNRNNKQ